MAITEILFRFTLGSIQSLIGVRDSFYLFLAWIWWWLAYPLKHKGHKLCSMQNNAKNLHKIPINIAFVISETISRDDLARLVCWSFSSNIHHVTLYNFQGKQIMHPSMSQPKVSCKSFPSPWDKFVLQVPYLF